MHTSLNLEQGTILLYVYNQMTLKDHMQGPSGWETGGTIFIFYTFGGFLSPKSLNPPSFMTFGTYWGIFLGQSHQNTSSKFSPWIVSCKPCCSCRHFIMMMAESCCHFRCLCPNCLQLLFMKKPSPGQGWVLAETVNDTVCSHHDGSPMWPPQKPVFLLHVCWQPLAVVCRQDLWSNTSI